MSIFSRMKKAIRGPEEHKKAAAAQTTAKSTPSSPSPSPKHVPTRFTRTCNPATPRTSVSAEEIQTRIAAARKMKSNTSLRTSPQKPAQRNRTTHIPTASKHIPYHSARASLDSTPTSSVSAEEIRTRIAAARKVKSNANLRKAQSPPQSGRIARTTSEPSIHHHTVRRTESSMSLDEIVVNGTCQSHAEHSGLQTRSWRPMGTYEDYTFRQYCELPEFANTRNASQTPLRPASYRAIRSMSSMPRMKSPLFSITVQEEEETDDYCSSSSQTSGFSEESRVSTASSQSTFMSGTRPQQLFTSALGAMQPPKLTASNPRSDNQKSAVASLLPFTPDDDLAPARLTKSSIPTRRYEDYNEDSQLYSNATLRPKRKPSLSTMFFRKGFASD